MAEIELKALTEQARELARSDRYDEAIAICRHILQRYPKHIESYLVLAEACLEKGKAEEATDLFKRVLSADPHNFLAHVGLGILYDQDGLLDEAIWHFERAFELRPEQLEVRQRLRYLYTVREGVERPRLKLNRAALGYLYLKGGLYPQAAAEFGEILADDPERVDIQLALAEAFWRDNKHREAAEVCQDLLNKMPNCLKANLLLGEIWLNSGLEEEGQTLLRRAQNLDPENLMAWALFGEASPLPLEKVLIAWPEEKAAVEVAEEAAEVEAVAPEVEAETEWLLPLEEAAQVAEEEAVAEELPALEVVEETVSPTEEALPALEAAEEKEVAEAEELIVAEALAPAEEEASPVIAALEAELGALPALTVEEISEEERAAIAATMPPESATPEEIMAWLRAQRAARGEEVPALGLLEEGLAPPEGVVEREELPAPEAVKGELPVPEVEAAAEEIVAAEIPAPEVVEEELPVPEVEVAEEGIVAPVEVAVPTVADYLAALAQNPADTRTRLALARAYAGEEAWDEAAEQYTLLATAASGVLDDVIVDLEGWTAKQPALLALHQVLGDAYMEAGQLDRALEKYNWLLTQV